MLSLQFSRQRIARFSYVGAVGLSAILLTAIVFGCAATAAAQTIHLIVAADLRGGDNAADSGASWRRGIVQDADNVKEVFMAQVPARNLHIVEVSGEETTPDAILDAVNTLDVQPNDSLVFYFSGHAAYDDRRDVGHYFQLSTRRGRPAPLSRTAVLRAMTQKKGRLNVLLTDCCSTFSNLPRSESFAVHAVIRPAEFSPLMRRLFLLPTGTVDLTSSQVGELSFVDSTGKNRGSCFTWPLVELMAEKELSDEITWRDFVRLLTVRVNQAFHECFPDGYKSGGTVVQTAQTVHAFELPYDGPERFPRFGARALSIRPSGVRLTGVAQGSPAENAGLHVGDVVHIINGVTIRNEFDYSEAIDRSPTEMTIDYRDKSGENKKVIVTLDQWSLEEYK